MPRPLRVHVDGALHFITSHAVAPLVLFRDEKDYATYLDLLNEYREKFGFKLFGFVLFHDHLHLCLEPTNGATVSAIMHALSSRYTKYFNRRHRHAGHLFQERFKSTLVEKAPSLLRLTAYLHLYPLRMGAVSDLAEYRWTSYAEYQRAGSDAVEVLEQLARAYPGLTYTQYVMSMTESEWQALRLELQQRVVGSPSFVALVEERMKAPAKPELDAPEPVAESRPRIVRLERQPAAILTGTFALAFVSLCAAALYARNLDTLRQTVQAMARERMAALSLATGSSDGPAARLASFNGSPQLNGAVVNIEMRAISGVSPDGQKDRLEFRRDQMISQSLGAAGFLPSRYTVAQRDDGTIAWETIQVDRTGATAHWQGEWDGQIMRGVMTKEEGSGKPSVQFTFVGATQPRQPRSET